MRDGNMEGLVVKLCKIVRFPELYSDVECPHGCEPEFYCPCKDKWCIYQDEWII